MGRRKASDVLLNSSEHASYRSFKGPPCLPSLALAAKFRSHPYWAVPL